MKTIKKRLIFVLVWMLLVLLPACGLKPLAQTHAASATEAALCDEWGNSLPSRSHKDTQQTQDEIGEGYDVYVWSCPGSSLPF